MLMILLLGHRKKECKEFKTQNYSYDSKAGNTEPLYDEISAMTALQPNPSYEPCELKVEKNPAYELINKPQSSTSSNPRGTWLHCINNIMTYVIINRSCV